MICSSCGANADEEKFFCPACKEPLKGDEDILPMHRDGEVQARHRAAAPCEPAAGEEKPATTARRAPWSLASHRLFSRSLALRVAITLVLLALLVLGLLLVASLKDRSGEKTPRLPLDREELCRRPFYSSVKARTAITTAKIITP